MQLLRTQSRNELSLGKEELQEMAILHQTRRSLYPVPAPQSVTVRVPQRWRLAITRSESHLVHFLYRLDLRYFGRNIRLGNHNWFKVQIPALETANLSGLPQTAGSSHVHLSGDGMS